MKKAKWLVGLLVAVMTAVAAIGISFAPDKVNAAAYEGLDLQMSQADWTAESVIVDPAGATKNNNYGGTITADVLTASVTGSTAIAFRVKNPTHVTVTNNQCAIRLDTNDAYVFQKSKYYLVGVDGKVTEVTSGGREWKIPSGFDGALVIPWTSLKRLRYPTDSGDVWTRKDAAGNTLPDGASGNYITAVDAGNFKAIDCWWKYDTAADPYNELLMGNVYIISGTEGAYTVAKTANVFPCDTADKKASNQSNGGTVHVTAYPTTKMTPSFTLNGKTEGVADAINLPAEGVSLAYGESFKPTVKEGWMIGTVKVDGTAVTDGVVRNLNTEASAPVVDIAAGPNYTYTIGDGADISLNGKAGISFAIDNTLGKAIEWKLTIASAEDGVADITTQDASKGAGIFVEEDGYTYYGDVFTIPNGFNGRIFVPFNVEGASYGAYNNHPFSDLKPMLVKAGIEMSYNFCEEITADTLATVISDWKYEAELPALSMAPEVNLYEDGDDDLVGGYMTKRLQTCTTGSAGELNYALATPLSFDALGLAFRIKNRSESSVEVRMYLAAANGGLYVPQLTEGTTQFIDKDGNNVKQPISNRDMKIPANFDGTMIVSLNHYATDIARDQNVYRNTDLNAVRFFVIGDPEEDFSMMVANGVTVLYRDGTTQFSAVTGKANDGKNLLEVKQIVKGTVTVKEAGVATADVTANVTSMFYGSHEIVVTPAEGKVLLSAQIGSTELAAQADGTFKGTFFYDGADAEVALNVTTDTLADATVTYDKSMGTVEYKNGLVDGTIKVGANTPYELVVKANDCFRVVSVAAGGNTLQAEGDVYTVPAGALSVTVTMESYLLDITVTINGGNVTVKHGTSAVTNGQTIKFSGDFALSVAPNAGYVAEVKFDDTVMSEVDGLYAQRVDSQNLAVTITVTKIVYNVTYVLNLGENATTNPATYTVTDTVTLGTPTKEGYDFVRWYFVNADEERETITEIAAGSTGDITLYAEFAIHDPAPAGSSDKGCGGSIAAGAFAAVGMLAAGAFLAIAKRKHD